MEVIVQYVGLEERTQLVKENESLGLTMLHDTFDPDWKRGEEPRGEMIFNDDPGPQIQIDPPKSTHISVLVTINVGVPRPARVRREWEGMDYFYDCFVTEAVKDQYLAGDIAVGDFLLVHYDPIGEQIVTAKIFKSW